MSRAELSVRSADLAGDVVGRLVRAMGNVADLSFPRVEDLALVADTALALALTEKVDLRVVAGPGEVCVRVHSLPPGAASDLLDGLTQVPGVGSLISGLADLRVDGDELVVIVADSSA